MLPTFYQTHLQKQLTRTQLILLTIWLDLIQSEKQVRLERESASISLPNYSRQSPSKANKISRFTSINDRANLVPLITYWLTTYCSVGQTLSIALAPTSMGVYQSFYARPNLEEKSYPIILVFVT
jgi:hypothetical protein